MLETISKAISTALFFLCTAIVTGLSPAPPAETVPVSQAIVEEIDDFSLVGEWKSGEQILKFTASGKLICGKTVMRYTKNGNDVTIIGTLNGTRREYTVKVLPEGERVISFNGVTMYKIK